MKENKREQVFVLLFEASFHGGNIEYISENLPKDSGISGGALAKAGEICKNIENIDANIKDKLETWDIKRVSRVPLSLMRLAVFEMMYEDGTPYGASVNEAVELCKKYASDEEASFINGILRAVSASLEKAGEEK